MQKGAGWPSFYFCWFLRAAFSSRTAANSSSSIFSSSSSFLKLFKRELVLALAFLIFILMPMNLVTHAYTQAAPAKMSPTPDWAYTNQTSTGLSISSAGEATATAQLTGYPGITTEVWIFMYLEQYSGGAWTTINSWNQLYSGYTGTLQRTAYVSSGYWYRVKASYYAYSGDDSENIVQFSNTVNY